MIVALGFCQKDAAAARDMLLWCEQLGGCREFDALMVTDPSTQWSEGVSVMDQAAKVFRAVHFVTAAKTVSTWPQGPNSLFVTGACHIADKQLGPFLWMEPDAAPLKRGWLETIHGDYLRCGRPFMGRIYQSNNAKLPREIMSGIAVYPEETGRALVPVFRDDLAWDVGCADFLVPRAARSNLIQWFWGQPDLAPTFAMAKTPHSPINTFTMANLESGAVLFHRNKDGTLLRCLRETAGIQRRDDVIVVFSFTRHDAPQMTRLMEWIVEIGTPRTHDCLLWYESGTEASAVSRIADTARRAFNSVFHGSYRCPGLGPNGAWQSAARQMMTMRHPWLWMEADAVPTVPDWLLKLQTRYLQQQKPFMGPVVPQYGHMNGTGIYPFDTPARCPNTMAQTARHGWAWDMVLKPEMIHICHDCSDLYQHAWIESGGKLRPHGDGIFPTFPTRQSLERLQPSAVIFHRNKDHTLIDRLREIRKTT